MRGTRRTIPRLAAVFLAVISGTSVSAQITAEGIANHIVYDSGHARDGYMEYSQQLADLLNSYSPEALNRILTNYVPAPSAPISLNKELNLSAINFGSLSSKLTPDAEKELDKVFDYLKNNPIAKILIEGHTDANLSYDQALSESRADSAMLYIATKGIDPARIETIGYAGTKPIAAGNSKAAKAQNRRIEIIVQ